MKILKKKKEMQITFCFQFWNVPFSRALNINLLTTTLQNSLEISIFEVSEFS